MGWLSGVIVWLEVVMVFSVLIIVHELGHFWAAIKSGIKVESFALGMGPKLFSVVKNGIEYKISLIPIGGEVRMAGDAPVEGKTAQPWEFMGAKVSSRFNAIAAGPVLNYLLGFILFSLVFYLGSPILTTEVGGLIENYPAQAAGVAAGDKILTIDEKSVSNWDEVTALLRKKTEGDITLNIDRNGSKIKISVSPQVKETKDLLGNKVTVAQIGIRPSDKVEYIKHGPVESIGLGAKEIVKVTKITYQGLWSLITGKLVFKESVSGPVGIINFMAMAARAGFVHLLFLTAYISALLAIFNLLPFPPLDGGHLLFLLIEKLRGRALTIKTQEIIMRIGWALLITLMLFATYNDLFRLIRK